MGGILEEESWRRNLGGGILEEEPWGRNPGGGILEEEPWGRNPGGGILGEESWRRNLGGGILEEESWRRNPGVQEASRRPLGSIQEPWVPWELLGPQRVIFYCILQCLSSRPTVSLAFWRGRSHQVPYFTRF